MPFDQVPSKFKAGTLHSGGPSGPLVKDRKQMLAIMLSEKRKAGSNPEYAPVNAQSGLNSVPGVPPPSAPNPGLVLFRRKLMAALAAKPKPQRKRPSAPMPVQPQTPAPSPF